MQLQTPLLLYHLFFALLFLVLLEAEVFIVDFDLVVEVLGLGEVFDLVGIEMS